MRWTRIRLFACVAVLATFAGAHVQAAPPPAPHNPPDPVEVQSLIMGLHHAKELNNASRQQLAGALVSATQPTDTQLVLRETALQVLSAAGKDGSVHPSKARSLVTDYRWAVLAATQCTTDCGTLNKDVQRIAEELAFKLSPSYMLRRDVYRVTLDASPIVRIQCSVANNRGSDAVVFDPQDARGLVRHAVLPKAGAIDGATVSCTSDRLQETLSGKEPAATYFYVLNPKTGSLPTSEVIGCWRNSSEGTRCKTKPALTVTIKPLDPEEATAFLQSFTTISPQSTLRSFDPSTLALDLIKVLGTVALERANEGLKHYVRSYLLTQICENLTVKKVIDGLDGSPLHEPFKLLPPDEPILATTCSVLESIRIDELASAKDVLWKALMADASRLTFRSLLPNPHLDPVASSVFEAAHAVLARSLLGEQSGTERDVQAMLLSLERMKPGNSALKCGIVAGMAVLRLCLRDNTCSADELNQLVRQESPGSDARPRNDSQIRELTQKVVYEQGEYDDKAKVLADALLAFEAPKDGQAVPAAADIAIAQALKATLSRSLRNLNELDVEKKLAALEDVDIASALEGDEVKTRRQQLLDIDKPRTDALETLRASLRTGTDMCDLGVATAQWPALVPLLGKIGDVLQPPPGATVAATSANALEIVTDLALAFLDESFSQTIDSDVSKVTSTDWTVVNEWQKKVNTTLYSRGTVNALRRFIGVLRGEDPAPAVAELGKALSEAIKQHCEENGGKCKVPVKSAQITRAFTVLTAISSYSASYRTGGKDGEVDEAAREEERKKALESVIDAFTDRSHRAGDFVFSLGADVGLQYAHMGKTSTSNKLPNGDTTDHVYNALSLPMGFAFQWLPNPQGGDHGCNFIRRFSNKIGCQIMITLIDPAQYATTSNWEPGAKFVRASPATALRFGVRAGFLFGEPSFPISVALHGSYSPALEMWTKTTSADSEELTLHTLGVVMYGISAGIYVPFLDFN